MTINRRNFIKNAAGILVAAPMVVRASSIMRILDKKYTELRHAYAGAVVQSKQCKTYSFGRSSPDD